jgi:CRP/FNR family transcriptional regulator, cyclic AMP receptor protein
MLPDTPEIEILRRGRWFALLPPALQERIAQRGVLRRFRTGQYLLRQGDPPRGLFGLVQGRTRHVCAVGEAQEVLMHLGGPGLWTGEYSLLSGAPAIGSVIADAPSQALFLSASDWQRIIDEEPRWLAHFGALMAERFATAFRAYADAQGLDRDEWVHARLRLVAQVEREHGASVATIRLSQSHLATMVGVSRQTLNAALARLQRRGLLRVGFRLIELVESHTEKPREPDRPKQGCYGAAINDGRSAQASPSGPSCEPAAARTRPSACPECRPAARGRTSAA